jgi:hypothetical protein
MFQYFSIFVERFFPRILRCSPYDSRICLNLFPKFSWFSAILPQAMATSYRPPRSFWGAAFDNLGQWWHLILSFSSDWWDILNRKAMFFEIFYQWWTIVWFFFAAVYRGMGYNLFGSDLH